MICGFKDYDKAFNMIRVFFFPHNVPILFGKKEVWNQFIKHFFMQFSSLLEN